MSDQSLGKVLVELAVTLAIESLLVAGCVYVMDIPELTFLRAMGGIALVGLAVRSREGVA